jgi:cytochrome c oxidase subunit III
MSNYPQEHEYRNLTFHPYNIMMSLLLFGVCVLFLALSASYIYSRVQHGLPSIKIPWMFLVNTLLLIGSSFTLMNSQKCYEIDDTTGYKRNLGLTLLLSILFAVAQCVAWFQMMEANDHINSSNIAGYIWAISILHLIHVLGGIPFLAAFYHVAIKRMKEPVSVLVYFSDPLKKLKLKLLTRYWHFLDILWIYLVLFFYLTNLLMAIQ